MLETRTRPSLLRKLWQLAVWIQFRLFHRNRLSRIVLERVRNLEIVVLPHVFNPHLFYSSDFFVSHLDTKSIPSGSRVLDMGTGSGVCAVVAASLGSQVVAVDIDPDAARCARINALIHRLEDRIEVRQGDLFAPVEGECFDTILFNPPYFRGEPKDQLDRAFRSEQVARRFSKGLTQHLAPAGSALVVLSSNGEIATFLEEFTSHSLAIELIAEQDVVNEVLKLYRLTAKTAA